MTSPAQLRSQADRLSNIGNTTFGADLRATYYETARMLREAASQLGAFQAADRVEQRATQAVDKEPTTVQVQRLLFLTMTTGGPSGRYVYRRQLVDLEEGLDGWTMTVAGVHVIETTGRRTKSILEALRALDDVATLLASS